MKAKTLVFPVIGIAALLACALFLMRGNLADDESSVPDPVVSAVSEADVSSEVPSVEESSSEAESSFAEESSLAQESSQADESSDSEDASQAEPTPEEDESSLPPKRRKGILTGTEDIELHDTDGGNTNFVFTYDGEDYTAVYTYDNWKIIDSYRIINLADMEVICQALIDVNPVHGKDYESYRTAKDMAYEWDQHNIAYDVLPDDNEWKSHVKDVDLNPEDQGKSFLDMYCDRTGKETIFD